MTANNHGKGVEGMLVLTELRLLFLPDIGAGSTTASFLEFNTVQVRAGVPKVSRYGCMFACGCHWY